MYEQIRLKELEMQIANIEWERERWIKDLKRSCLELARNFTVTNATELVFEAQILYDFIK